MPVHVQIGNGSPRGIVNWIVFMEMRCCSFLLCVILLLPSPVAPQCLCVCLVCLAGSLAGVSNKTCITKCVTNNVTYTLFEMLITTIYLKCVGIAWFLNDKWLAASAKSSILQNCTHRHTHTTWLKTKLVKLYHTKTYTNYLSWTKSNNTNNSTHCNDNNRRKEKDSVPRCF